MWRNERAARGRTWFGPYAGQRWILAGFVVLLGGVLPFVCWGNSADPAHPHQVPHFVFGAPVMHVHTGMSAPHPATTSGAPEATGVAHPAMLLLTLLGVALSAGWHWPSPGRCRAVYRPHTFQPFARGLPVPTPPPR